jgi:hypothetical protein
MIPPSARMMSPPTLYIGERLRKLRFLMTDNMLGKPDTGPPAALAAEGGAPYPVGSSRLASWDPYRGLCVCRGFCLAIRARARMVRAAKPDKTVGKHRRAETKPGRDIGHYK